MIDFFDWLMFGGFIEYNDELDEDDEDDDEYDLMLDTIDWV